MGMDKVEGEGASGSRGWNDASIGAEFDAAEAIEKARNLQRGVAKMNMKRGSRSSEDEIPDVWDVVQHEAKIQGTMLYHRKNDESVDEAMVRSLMLVEIAANSNGEPRVQLEFVEEGN